MSAEAWAELLVQYSEQPSPKVPDLPSEDVQRITNSQVGRVTMQGGSDWYLSVRALLARAGVALEPDHTLLDVGVGWGRMLRFLLRDVPVENMAGVEVDPRLVKACDELLPGGRFALVEPRDPLPFADGEFDVVVNNSLFSHLSEAQHLHTLSEMVRVTRPGGHIISTVLTRRHVMRALIDNPNPTLPWSTVDDPAAFLKKVEAGEFCFIQTRKGMMAEYGLAIAPIGWIREHWGPGLEVIGFDDECPSQSLVLARKV